jgi:TetR/AcrR family transcriptional regulator
MNVSSAWMNAYPARVASRRAPAPENRRQDPERTRRALLNAALDEFSEKGYAGARVQDIADRAGVNKQLISYHFGGKEGLYCAIRRNWLAREAEFAAPGLGFEDLVLRYLANALDDPRGVRLAVWRSLTEDPADVPLETEDLTSLRACQRAGEVGADLDPAYLMVMLHALVTAPVTLRGTVSAVGLDPAAPEFRARYAEQLRLLLRRLADRPPQDA